MVGRVHELATLTTALRRSLAGRGELVTISGEAGMGKTRLVGTVAARSRAMGAHVLWGTGAGVGGVPAFGPWSAILHAYVREVDEDEARSTLGPAMDLLRRIVPDLGRQGAPRVRRPTPPTDEPAGRTALFEAAAGFFARAATRRPLVLVIDDLHEADLPSLHLLQLVARSLATTSMLVVVTYRDAELRRRPEAARVVEALGPGTTLPLLGLAAVDVGRLVAARVDVDLPPPALEALRAATGGNPFLVEEIVRVLAADGRLERFHARDAGFDLPRRAGEMIRQRLDLLSSSTREMLRVAALIGPVWAPRELTAACDRPDEEVLERLRESIEDGIVEAEPPTRGWYRFRHALFREALAAELPAATRQALHQAIGEALEYLYRDDPDPSLDRLAYHFIRSAPSGDWRRAVHHASAAGTQALARFAFEDAAAYFEAAVAVLDAVGVAADPRRCELLLWLGVSRRNAAEVDGARAAFSSAAAVARVLERPDLLARAALGFAPWVPYGRTNDSGLGLLEEALAAQPEGASALRAELSARIAYILDGTAGAHAPRHRILALARDAVAMARDVGAAPTLGRALFEARWVDWDPASFASRRAMTDELLAVAGRLHDRHLAVVGEGWRVADCLELGDPSAMDGAMRRHGALANELREPEHLWWSEVWRAMRAIAEGRLQEGEELVARALELGGRVEPENALLVAYVQHSRIRVDRGQLDEALADLEQVVAARREVLEADATVACRKARLLAELGELDRARAEFDRVAADDFRALTVDMRYADNLGMLAVACAALDDQGRAPVLYRRLRAATGRNLLFGPALVASGPAARYQGLLAATMRRRDVARRHFEAALTMSRRMGWAPLAARTQCEYAASLLRHGRQADRPLATHLLDDAERVAEALGLERLVRTVHTLRAECRSRGPAR